jgi:biotin carboxylase
MRVLVVGTVRPYHKVLIGDGHEVTLFVAKNKLDLVSLQDAYEAVIVHPPHASNALLLDLAKTLHRERPFDYVVSYTDLSQDAGHYIAVGLGVPCEIDGDVLRRTANKAAMRKALASAGIPSCRHVFAQGTDALRAVMAEVGMPCIIKPVAGQASRSVAKVEREADIDAALSWVGQTEIDAGVIVEEFMHGEEYSVEALSDAGKHYIYSVTQKFKNSVTFVETGHLVPAPLDAALHAKIAQYVKDALTALGFVRGPSHTEIIVTPNGPRIVETHTRLAGDKIIDLVKYATGEDMYEISARQSIGQDVTDRLGRLIEYQQSAAIWYACPESPSRRPLVSVNGVEGVKARSDVKHVEVLKKVGTVCDDVCHSHDRYALVIAVGPSGEAALSVARQGIADIEFVCAETA